MTPAETALTPALRAERLRLHRSVLASSVTASAIFGIVLATQTWPAGDATRHWIWLACLAAALGARLLVAAAHGRAAPSSQGDATWLRRYRASFGVHGMVWALAPLMPGAMSGPAELDLLTVGLVAIATGSLIATAFDIAAALLFAVPTLTSLVAHLLVTGHRVTSGGVLILSLFLIVTLLSALRMQRLLRQRVSLGLAEAARADEGLRSAQRADSALRELADKHRLLDTLLQTTPQGFWFMDAQGLTSDVNPAMCALLGRPREAIVGHSPLDFFAGEDLRTLQRELRARREGQPGVYEIGVTRQDGGSRHCVVSATPLFDAGGQTAGEVAVWTDISLQRQATAALRIYEQAVNSIADMVSVIDEGHVYRMVNDEWCRSTGVARADVIGRKSFEVIPAAIDEQRHRAVDECIELRQKRVVRGRGGLPDHAGRHFETSYYPYADDDTGARRVVVVSRDVTAEEQAMQRVQEGEAEMRAVLDAFPGYIVAIDQGYIYTYCNERMAELMGRSVTDMVGQHVRDVLGEERYLENKRRREQAAPGQTRMIERTYTRAADQQPISIEVTYVSGPLQPDGRQRAYAFGVDITARKKAEQALVAARDEADRANRAKSEFLSRMSHELRTPLNAILGFGQLLHGEPSVPAEPRSWAGEIVRGGHHLLELINEVLDLARVESGQFTVSLEPVALAAVLDECLNLVRPQALSRGVHLPLVLEGCDLQVQADRTRLKQALLNLLSNAVKYNRAAGTVSLSCTVEPHGPGHAVRICIGDSGAGLTSEQQQRLFVPFERLDADRSQIEGTGIGLALSKRLVELMRGSIGVDSTPGMGSTFWIRLPVADGPGDAAVALDTRLAALEEPHPTRQFDVLCIEDNPANLRLIAGMLAKRANVRLLSSIAPGLGLELARTYRPALILLDINLPDMDGYAVLQCLREHEATRGIPVLAISANAMPRDLERGRAAGFADYLTKPIDVSRFLGAVDRLLGP